jgi:squalene-hopene/tetraprenyl-beta-curcumene cyclase
MKGLVGLLALGCVHAEVVPPVGGPAKAAPPPSAPATIVAAPAASAPAPRPLDPRPGLQRALAFLERDGIAWMEGKIAVQGGTGCVSCHHVGFALWSHREARRAGLATNQARVDQLEEQAQRFFTRKPSEGRAPAWGQLLLGRDASQRGRPERWRVELDALVAGQRPDGTWNSSGQFPTQRRPMAETDAVTTMWTLLAFGTFAELPPKVAASRGRAWSAVQAGAAGDTTEWLVTRLLVERQLGSPAAASALHRRLLDQQRPDGGWGWRGGEPSNAYSTGQALYGLGVAGAGPEQEAVRRGIESLLATQSPDGTWSVPSRLISQNGNPRRDYIYQYWGSAWAAIGLARTLAAAPSVAQADRPRSP